MDSVIRAAEALLSLLQQKKLTLAAAEGSSGGALSQALTALPGASAVFQAGIVGYSDSAKQQHIGVPAKVFRRYGAVSE